MFEESGNILWCFKKKYNKHKGIKGNGSSISFEASYPREDT